jgi:hypothetical protein
VNRALVPMLWAPVVAAGMATIRIKSPAKVEDLGFRAFMLCYEFKHWISTFLAPLFLFSLIRL